MEIRLKESGQVVLEGEFRSLFPNTSLPTQLSEELINDLGGEVVLEGPQAQPSRYQVAFRDGVEQIDGKWFTKWSVADMDPEAITALDEQQAKAIRDQRNQKLSACDWTQVADAPVDKEAWATYRQSLRDISTQQGFPWDIQWPTEPN